MRRIFALFALMVKDLKLLTRGYVILLAFGMVALGIAGGHLLRGRDLELTEAVYLVDLTEDVGFREEVAAELASRGFDQIPYTGDLEALSGLEGRHQVWLPDEATLEETLRRSDGVGFGVVIWEESGEQRTRYLMPDVLPEGTATLMARLWDDRLQELRTGEAPASVSIRQIGGAGAEEPPPLGQTVVPLFIFSEAFIIAIWFGAILLLTERSERTIFALTASPAGLGGMLTAMFLALLAIVLLEVTLTVVGVWGYHRGLVVALLASSIVFAQGMGITIACAGYFQSLTGFSIVGAAITYVLTLPIFSFIAAGFPDLWWMPTYPPMRALREGFFPSGRPELIWTNLGWGAIYALILLILGFFIYRRRLARS